MLPDMYLIYCDCHLRTACAIVLQIFSIQTLLNVRDRWRSTSCQTRKYREQITQKSRFYSPALPITLTFSLPATTSASFSVTQLIGCKYYAIWGIVVNLAKDAKPHEFLKAQALITYRWGSNRINNWSKKDNDSQTLQKNYNLSHNELKQTLENIVEVFQTKVTHFILRLLWCCSQKRNRIKLCMWGHFH